MKRLLLALFAVFTMTMTGLHAQSFVDRGKVTGSFQFDGQYYMADEALGITGSTLDGKLFRMNGFGNIISCFHRDEEPFATQTDPAIQLMIKDKKSSYS